MITHIKEILLCFLILICVVSVYREHVCFSYVSDRVSGLVLDSDLLTYASLIRWEYRHAPLCMVYFLR
jgi:hypothetical protein